VTADAGSLTAGQYTATVTVSASGYDAVLVPVTLNVTDPDPDPPPEGEVLFDASFESGLDGFTYQDDLFRGTAQPSFASGARIASGGESGAGLEVQLGGGAGTVVDMSGGFVRSFTLAADQYVTLAVSYRHLDSGTYEADECSQLIVAVDGVHLSTTARDHLNEYCGNERQSNVASDTGWRRFQIPLFLTAGTHTVAIGGYNDKKTSNNERAWLRFDNVRLETGYQDMAALTTDVIDIDLQLSAGAASTRTFDVARVGGGTIAFDLTSNVPWATPATVGGSTPDTVTINIDAAQLGSGIYNGVIRASTGGHNDATVNLRLVVP
jgi:hypothetical protein